MLLAMAFELILGFLVKKIRCGFLNQWTDRLKHFIAEDWMNGFALVYV